MTKLKQAKELLRESTADKFIEMIYDSGLCEDVLYRLACDNLNTFNDKQLDDFIKNWSWEVLKMRNFIDLIIDLFIILSIIGLMKFL